MKAFHASDKITYKLESHKQNQMRRSRDEQLGSPKSSEQIQFDQYLVDDDDSSLGSLISEGLEDDNADGAPYQASMMLATNTSDPEELVDQDLMGLLSIIK